jgi:hypothetical protein
MPSLDWDFADIITPEAHAIVEHAPLPGLGHLPKCTTTSGAIKALLADKTSISASGGNPQSESLALAGLWLLAGELDRSHTLSQSIETAVGAYWHGIMHRREGDFWNSKYWFRRVCRQPVLAELAEQIASQRKRLEGAGLGCQDLVNSQSLAGALVDLCQAALSEKPDLSPQLELICWWEWQLLFRYSVRKS